MVDHTFVVHQRGRQDARLTHAGDLGEIYYYDSVRINLGLFQHDVNVLFWILPSTTSPSGFRAGQVSGGGLGHRPCARTRPAREHRLHTMSFDGQLIAHVHVNWLAPLKVRRTLLGGSRRMIVFDDLEPARSQGTDRGISVNPARKTLVSDCSSPTAPATCVRRSLASPRRCTRSHALRRLHRADQVRRTDGHAAFAWCACSTRDCIDAQQGRPSRVAASTTPSSEEVAAVVYISLFALTAAFRFLALKNGSSNDHFVYNRGGRQMLFGEWPTRDWIDPGLPLMFGASALAQAVFGSTLVSPSDARVARVWLAAASPPRRFAS